MARGVCVTSGDFHGLVAGHLDEFDRKLVTLLQEDGRMPFTAMASAVGLSHAAVRQRIQRLLAERVVTVGAITNPETHGYATSAAIGISVDHRISEVSAAVAEIPEVYYLVTANGHYDMLAEVMAEDDLHLQHLVMTVRAIPGVRSTETITFVDTVKWVYRPAFKGFD
jgi:Lrp/AsnC family transcriptional regulator, regulator for asnA, asnC and gidA